MARLQQKKAGRRDNVRIRREEMDAAMKDFFERKNVPRPQFNSPSPSQRKSRQKNR